MACQMPKDRLGGNGQVISVFDLGSDEEDLGLDEEGSDEEEEEEDTTAWTIFPDIANGVSLRGGLDLRLSGKVFLDEGTVFMAVCFFKTAKMVDEVGSTFPQRNVILALRLGSEKRVDAMLLSSSYEAAGTLHGLPVTGRRFSYQPHVHDITNLQVFVGCAICGPPHFEEEAGFFDEFSPFKYKCLEFVDWDLSAKVEATSKAAAKGRTKTKSGAKAKLKAK